MPGAAGANLARAPAGGAVAGAVIPRGFALPHALLPLAARYPNLIYRLLFDAAAHTLLRVARERLGGAPGITAVLHTWGQQLQLHPHLHCIVSGGAFAADGAWRAGRSPRYLCPVGVMGAIFRGGFLAGLTALKQRGVLEAPRRAGPRCGSSSGRKRSGWSMPSARSAGRSRRWRI